MRTHFAKLFFLQCAGADYQVLLTKEEDRDKDTYQLLLRCDLEAYTQEQRLEFKSIEDRDQGFALFTREEAIAFFKGLNITTIAEEATNEQFK